MIRIFVLLLLAFCPFAADVAAEDRPPNIVLVMADDQGWGDMAYNGHPVLKTPHFDAMAREALRLDRFYAAAPVCSPTRGAVLTGRHPNRFGCFSWGHSLRPQEITVAEALREAGYVTGHFGKWHLGSVREGSPVNPGASGFDRWISAPNFFENDAILSDGGKAVQTQGESSEVVVDLSLEFIEQSQASGKPFLAVVWFGSPHAPHVALPEDVAGYPDQPRAKQNFYSEVTAMDRAFGKLRKGLEELGVRENTVLWYTSDNGALPRVGSSGGFRGKKGDIYNGGLLVPAMIEWPARIPTPRHDATPLNSTDILPTVLEIAGVPVPDDRPLDGVSLLPLIEGRPLAERSMGFWSYPVRGISTPSAEWMAELLAAQQSGAELPSDPVRLRMDAGEIEPIDPPGFPGHAAWVSGPWKLHRIQPANRPEPRFELYDLEADPNESMDLASKESSRMAAMRKELEAWLASVVSSHNGEDY
ncbi:sulfatase family protein [Candidatus Laterigemmans baculatus]|uniref:sulfatase family protein n=1 Tax=Candidatus Laterigemmans baculatus TaxID=2770505 RepID=UPI0013DB64FE|nr:sulfatase-like hydrolase/transferase [Candidatus Laterigemmans baculatus]